MLLLVQVAALRSWGLSPDRRTAGEASSASNRVPRGTRQPEGTLRRFSRKIAIAVAALLPGLGLASPAGAHHTTASPPTTVYEVTGCGQVISSPGTYNLSHNVGPCTGDGIVITSTAVTATGGVQSAEPERLQHHR